MDSRSTRASCRGAMPDERWGMVKRSDEELRTCPVCGARVNVYNLNVDPDGEVVGCSACGKTRRDPTPARKESTPRR